MPSRPGKNRDMVDNSFTSAESISPTTPDSEWKRQQAVTTSAGVERSPLSQLLSRLFSELNDAGVRYCVLRNFEDLPESVGHDLDLFVCALDLGLFRTLLMRCSLHVGWEVIRTNTREGFHSWYLTRLPGTQMQVLQVDVWTRIHWKSLEYIDSRHLVATRQDFSSFKTANPGCEAAISLLKEYLQAGKVKDRGDGSTKKRIRSLLDVGAKDFVLCLQPYFPRAVVDFLLNGASRGEWEALEKRVSNVKRSLLMTAASRSPVRLIRGGWRFLIGHVRDGFLQPSGLFVCLVGPDGSGKTTLADGLVQDDGVGALFSRVRYYHGHFGLLPALKKLLFWKRHDCAIAEIPHRAAVTSASGSASRPFSFIRTLTYVLYYSCDYFLGHLVLSRAKGQGELIVFDRYFYDYAVQGVYSAFPRSWLRVLEWLLPRPDILIWPRADAAVIQSRKPELSLAELKRQIASCERLLCSPSRTAAAVSSDQGAQETLAEVKRLIFGQMLSRAKRKGDW